MQTSDPKTSEVYSQLKTFLYGDQKQGYAFALAIIPMMDKEFHFTSMPTFGLKEYTDQLNKVLSSANSPLQQMLIEYALGTEVAARVKSGAILKATTDETGKVTFFAIPKESKVLQNEGLDAATETDLDALKAELLPLATNSMREDLEGNEEAIALLVASYLYGGAQS